MSSTQDFTGQLTSYDGIKNINVFQIGKHKMKKQFNSTQASGKFIEYVMNLLEQVLLGCTMSLNSKIL